MLTDIGKLRDIEPSNIAIERLGDKISRWRYVIAIGSFLRRATFLPLVLSTVSLLVVMRSGDSLSICLNTVAILFLAEADNMAYHLGLAEAQKARMESAGRVALTAGDSEKLVWTRVVYAPAVSCTA